MSDQPKSDPLQAAENIYASLTELERAQMETDGRAMFDAIRHILPGVKREEDPAASLLIMVVNLVFTAYRAGMDPDDIDHALATPYHFVHLCREED
jgi:hypothetical protein